MENQTPTQEAVGFPTHSPQAPKKGIAKWVVFVVLLLVILGAGVFFLLRSSNEAIEAPTSTPSIRAVETVYTPEPEAETTTPTPAAVDKSKIKIEVLNGTGTAGDAGTAKTALTGAGFTQVETGNATSQTATTTTVTFDSTVSDATQKEIKQTLEKIFQSVEIRTGTVSGGFNVRVTTGPKKGATSTTVRASSTPRASTSPRPSASPVASSSPSAN